MGFAVLIIPSEMEVAPPEAISEMDGSIYLRLHLLREINAT